LYSGYELWRLRLFSFCGYELALVALALVVFGAYDCYPIDCSWWIFRKGTSELVDFSDKPFAVGGFLLRWINQGLGYNAPTLSVARYRYDFSPF